MDIGKSPVNIRQFSKEVEPHEKPFLTSTHLTPKSQMVSYHYKNPHQSTFSFLDLQIYSNLLSNNPIILSRWRTKRSIVYGITTSLRLIATRWLLQFDST